MPICGWPGTAIPVHGAESGTLETHRGIEVGQVFYLGKKYSEAMGATYLDAEGRERPIEMGCYGIGISRLVAAAIEQNHDANGIIWPFSIAPFHVLLPPINYKVTEPAPGDLRPGPGIRNCDYGGGRGTFG